MKQISTAYSLVQNFFFVNKNEWNHKANNIQSCEPLITRLKVCSIHCKNILWIKVSCLNFNKINPYSSCKIQFQLWHIGFFNFSFHLKPVIDSEEPRQIIHSTHLSFKIPSFQYLNIKDEVATNISSLSDVNI